jgi:hypothetical protein
LDIGVILFLVCGLPFVVTLVLSFFSPQIYACCFFCFVIICNCSLSSKHNGYSLLNKTCFLQIIFLDIVTLNITRNVQHIRFYKYESSLLFIGPYFWEIFFGIIFQYFLSYWNCISTVTFAAFATPNCDEVHSLPDLTLIRHYLHFCRSLPIQTVAENCFASRRKEIKV